MSCKDISIIVPAHQANDLLFKLLNALAQLQPIPLEFILVLDGDTGPVVLPEMSFPSKILINKGPRGAAATRNTGAKAAIGEYIFFMDADILPGPELVGKASGMIEKDPATDAWFGSYDNEPSETNFFSQYKNLFNHFIHQRSSTNANTFWSACGLIKRKVFESCGGFDDRYRMLEDIEMGYRLKEKGYTIKLDKGLQVKHQKKWTFGSLIRSDIFDRAVPWTKLLLRYGYTGRTDLNLKSYARASFLLVLLLIASGITIFFYPMYGMMGLFASIALLLILNWSLYRFYATKGPGFLLRAIGMHWLYYLYSGISFCVTATGYFISGKKR